VPPNAWTLPRQRLAPTGVVAIRLCRYTGLNAQPRFRLTASRLVSSRDVIGQLVTDFDALRPLKGAMACPADDGSQILALLAYPNGHRVTISTGLGGCTMVTNGKSLRTAVNPGKNPAGPKLLELLMRLVGKTHTSSH
jgi:hypothetical protein